MMRLLLLSLVLISIPALGFDTDGDGLADVDELNTYFTNPNLADSDFDTLNDGWEVSEGLDPLRANYLVSVGDKHSCVIDDVGLKCWGGNASGQINVPAAITDPTFVSAGGAHTCAINANTDVYCWGDATSPAVSDAPQNVSNPKFLVSGDFHNCLIDDNGLQCWGENGNGESTVPAGLENPVWVGAGLQFTCVVDNKAAGSEVLCFGKKQNGKTKPPELTNPVSVSLGDSHACARDDSGLVCWGDTTHGRTTIPLGLTSPEWFDVGRSHTCAIDDGLVSCWGKSNKGQLNAPVIENPKQLAAGDNHNCVLTDVGVTCWGDDGSNQSTPPALFFDADGDGISNADDDFPNDPNASADTDGDGMPDSYEDANGLDKTVNDADLDLDNDNLSNFTEYQNGTDPQLVEYSRIDTKLNIAPKYHRFGDELAAGACDATPVSFTLQGGDADVQLGSAYIDQLGSGFDNYSLVTDGCSGVLLGAGSTCSMTVRYCPNNTAQSASAELKVTTQDTDVPIVVAHLVNHEGDVEQARRRLPPVISGVDFTLKSSGATVDSSQPLLASETYSVDLGLTGYDEKYYLIAVWFDCSAIANIEECGRYYSSNIGSSGWMVLSPNAEAGAWQYQGEHSVVDSNSFTGSFDITTPAASASDKTMVLRVYQVAEFDARARKNSLSLIFAGGLDVNYFDEASRRVSFTVQGTGGL